MEAHGFRESGEQAPSLVWRETAHENVYVAVACACWVAEVVALPALRAAVNLAVQGNGRIADVWRCAVLPLAFPACPHASADRLAVDRRSAARLHGMVFTDEGLQSSICHCLIPRAGRGFVTRPAHFFSWP